MGQRKELIKFNELDFNYQKSRINDFIQAKNLLFENLCRELPEKEVVKRIDTLDLIIQDRSIDEDRLKEMVQDIIMACNPDTEKYKRMGVGQSIMNQLMVGQRIEVDQFLSNVRPLLYQRQINERQALRSCQYISWYPKQKKFILSAANEEKLKDKFSIFVQGEQNLKIYDAIVSVRDAINNLDDVGFLDWSANNINIEGLGISGHKTMEAINLRPFRN